MRSFLVSVMMTVIVMFFVGTAYAAPASSPATAPDSGGDTLEQFLQKCKAVGAIKEASAPLDGADGFKAGFEFGQCVGYISGVLELHAVVRGADPDAALFCLSSHGITINEVIKLVTKYADEHPEDLKKSASVNLLGILMSVFPCQEPSTKNSDSPRPAIHL
jgi:hypothetical protein